MPGASARTMRGKSGGAVAMERRSVVKALRAHVRSTLPEARAVVTAVVRTRSWREAEAGDGRIAHVRGEGGGSDRAEGGGRPASPSGAGEARSGSSATRAVVGGPCRRRAHVDGNGERHALEENVGGSERSEAAGRECGDAAKGGEPCARRGEVAKRALKRGTDHGALSVNEARQERQRPEARGMPS